MNISFAGNVLMKKFSSISSECNGIHLLLYKCPGIGTGNIRPVICKNVKLGGDEKDK